MSNVGSEKGAGEFPLYQVLEEKNEYDELNDFGKYITLSSEYQSPSSHLAINLSSYQRSRQGTATPKSLPLQPVLSREVISRNIAQQSPSEVFLHSISRKSPVTQL